MPCERIEIPGMGVGIICSRRTRPTLCGFCGAPCTRECDFPSGRRSGTCDAKMCDKCRTPGGHEIDYCPPHAPFVFAAAGHRIVVANMRGVKDGIRVDRGTPLGNPFRLEREA